ncbi:hypothetical protein A6046_00370 [[Haemophilus] ducreyi]|uniref:Uncharacterized protein n=2 Tax=Haemophilus ducreyi TaxID=730 RepID=Q7VMH5_HAEDU|nr:UPF0149 family protein [[Haemophilus] ducreyi]AAP95881.1 hypothetical protein HD_1002 [[Haemophilus] ducreyi 35000HP]AKO30896.1 hypothetical protein RY60_03980 [[Haemophilus] ducreyi]AKO32335.1 hypothetical protein RZ57_03990 [[Haemophilus] ducreyi]AKO33789.1 hypothetical protein RZ58_04005 [[Haemophilus] ducreyi]AKO35236.1 hypothetical protein RZ59_03965 [[Haemophilus] ducreyi]
MAITHSNEFNHLIAELEITETAAELHGFLSGLVAGGVQDESWKTLCYQFLNDGHAFSQQPLNRLAVFYQQLSENFNQANTLFSVWIPPHKDGFALADAIADWTNQFLLGLGLAQPKLSREIDEIGEALDDLEEIAKLGYQQDDNNDELLDAGEEVLEYLSVLALFLHSHFGLGQKPLEKLPLH